MLTPHPIFYTFPYLMSLALQLYVMLVMRVCVCVFMNVNSFMLRTFFYNFLISFIMLPVIT